MKNIVFAPILLFTYKRLDVLKRTIGALQQNLCANESELFIFSDAAKIADEEPLISKVREFIKTINGFKEIHIFEATSNMGLANSIISGVTRVINEYGKVIVLEDDLLTSSNFLVFMNQCLEHYSNNNEVFSISGYAPPLRSGSDYNFDVFFFPRNSSHGWATWKDKWLEVDWKVSDYHIFINNRSLKAKFNYGGSDLSKMLKQQMEGKINSWSVRFCYHQFRTNTYTVYPVISKIQNIGFGKEATHTKTYNRYYTILDNGYKLEFTLPSSVHFDEKNYTMAFKKFHSLKARGIGKIKTYLYLLGLIKNV